MKTDCVTTIQTPMEALIPLMREQLETGESVHFSPKGISMLPMLRQGVDSVVLSPLPEKLQKYDIPLYQRSNGHYVLHRVIHVGQTYTCMGDNQFVEEPGLLHSQMIGVVTGFYRKGKFHSVKEPGYRLYCRLWFHSRHIRCFIHRGSRFLGRMFQQKQERP